MRKFRYVVLVTVFLLAFSFAAAADPIIANTTITFGTGGCGNCIVFPGGATIMSVNNTGNTTVTGVGGVPQINITLNPGETSNITLGVFQVTSTSSASLGSSPSFNGAQVFVRVTLTTPGPLSQIFSGTLAGTANQTASGLEITWNATPLTFTLPGGNILSLKIEPTTLINAPTGNSTQSQIRGTGGLSQAPEPATLVLLGLGTSVLFGRIRRKFRRG